ncbi:MAG: acriflavine resistance protein B [Gammaproteobacteria bacterium]|nr:acriflavine resistance protein B [Gammaproteobacteria bacterium]|tara:strand:- start:93052 stop:96219 length:3168 start_codon:yes stop_codon:yes gene_type:complete
MSRLHLKQGIIPWFAANPVAANLLMILVIVLGIFQVGELRKEAFPSLEPNSLSISVTYNSGSAEQSEEGIAIKIEEQLEEVIGIKTMTSSSTGSGVTISIEKENDYDLDTLLRDVKAQVDAISNFPADAEKPVIEKSEREEHSIWLQLYGDTDRHTLQALAQNLKTDLLGQSDISRVSIAGWRDPMMVIEISEGQLQALGLTLSDVEDAINQSSSNTMTATLKNENVYLQLKASEQAYVKTDFEKILLKTASDGTRIYVGDVAEVRDIYDDDSVALSRFRGHDSLAIQVITTGQDDISDSVTAAKKVVQQWHDSNRLPQGVELASWYDRSESINSRLELMVKNAITGVALVFILLAVFLNLTVAFWVAMGLPFIFFGTLFLMGDSFVGLSLNEFTTFGFIMALGIVVDDAVVVGESVYTTKKNEGDSLLNTVKGTMKVAVPTLFGVFTTIVAFFSLTQISGRLGELYSQFAMVVAICLILSIIESKLILPSHLAHLKTTHRSNPNIILRGIQWVQAKAGAGLYWFNDRLYKPALDLALVHRYAVVIIFIAGFALVAAMPMTGALKVSFFPQVPGDTVRAVLNMESDTSYGQTFDALMELETTAYATDKELMSQYKESELKSGIANLQLASESDQSGRITVELDENSPYDIQVFTQEWKKRARTPEGARSLSIANRRETVDALRIELRANSNDVLESAGEQLTNELNNIAGVSGVEDNLEASMPQLFLKLNAQGEALGLTTDMLAQQVLTAFNGQVVQRYQRNSDEIEVRVRYPESDRQNPLDVLNAKVRTDDGDVIPLSSVALVEYGFTRDTITRIDNKKAVYITAEVDKDVMPSQTLTNQLNEGVVAQLKAQFPSLDIEFAGEAREQKEAESSMSIMFVGAMLMIYILLAVPLKSYFQPVIIMTAIPFGIVGAMLGHWINDLSLSILSFNGIIALSGVVVNDSLLLVSRFNELRKEEPELSVFEALNQTCRGRLRAILLTSLTTFAGLVPLLSETSKQAQFLIPAAASLGYGIMFATAVTLILIPMLLAIQEDCAQTFRSLKAKIAPSKEESVC